MRHDGVDERRLAWIRGEQPVERLWAAQQIIRSAGAGALLVWLSHVRPEQIPRVQVVPSSQSDLVFLIRPEPARREASAGPLCLTVAVRPYWSIEVGVVKRSGAPLESILRLDSVPGGLRSILTRRLHATGAASRPSALPHPHAHALGLPPSSNIAAHLA